MAERLRVEDGAAFQVLSETQIIFRYHDEDTDYQMLAPLIGLDRDGAVWEIRFNAAIMTIAECSRAAYREFQRAHRRFLALTRDPDQRVERRMRPGEIAVFDNRRVLHGRHAFSEGAGEGGRRRHLQGAYVEWEDVNSKSGYCAAICTRMAAMETVRFTQMKDVDLEDYQFLDGCEREFATGTADRVLVALADLENSMSGYQVSRLEHSLQTATLAERDGADEQMVVTALLHDIGDGLAPWNHGALAAAVLQPYVREECVWIATHHGLFQKYYYAHHLGDDRNERNQYRDHPHYQACMHFCEDWNQAAFDPAYDSHPLEHFAPLVREVLHR